VGRGRAAVRVLGNVLLASYYGTEIDGVRHSYALTIDRAALLLTMAVATATGIAFGLLRL